MEESPVYLFLGMVSLFLLILAAKNESMTLYYIGTGIFFLDFFTVHSNGKN